LPERVDLIVSVFTGNFLVSEDLLPSLFYARDRYLKPGGSLIPDSARMVVAPVNVASFYDKYINKWLEPLEDFDVSQARAYAANTLYSGIPSTMKPELLSEPEILHEIDFMSATTASCQERIEITINREGVCHGFLGWFTATVGESELSTAPDSPPMHWCQVFMPIERPLEVSKGACLGFELNRPDYGEWTWTVDDAGRKQRQSTFLSEPRSREMILKKSEYYRPVCSDQGKAIQKALQLMSGELTSREISSRLRRIFPHIFRTDLLAREFVVALAEKYS
jgi:Arginine methyltransferase oligomerization subdomain